MFRSRYNSSYLNWVFLLITIIVFIFIYAPIFSITLTSLSPGERAIFPLEGFSLKWYGILFTNSSILEALKTSIIIGISTMVITVIIAICAAYVMVRYNFRGKDTFIGILLSPMIIPWLIVGISLLSFYQLLKIPSGLINIILGHVAVTTPYAALVIAARLQGFNIHLEEMARSLGANEIQIFTRIMLPYIFPGILGAALLTFIMSFDEFIITFFLIGPGTITLPIKIMSMLRFGISPEINALSTIIVALSATIFIIASFLLTRKTS